MNNLCPLGNLSHSSQDVLIGRAVVNCKTPEKHDGITLALDGIVNLQLSNKSVGITKAFYYSAKTAEEGPMSTV